MKSKPTTRWSRAAEWLLTALVIALLLGMFSRSFNTHGSNGPNRAVLLDIYTNLSVGMSEIEAARLISSRIAGELKMVVSEGGFLVRMPLEWGASDWMLLVGVSNQAVTSVQVRSSDGPRPAQAPPDKPTVAHPLEGGMRLGIPAPGDTVRP